MQKDIKDPNCSQCGFALTCKNKCQTEVMVSDKPLLIVLPYPDNASEKADDLKAGAVYKSLLKTLTFFKADIANIHFTYLVKCNPQDKKVQPKELENCMDYLRAEIEFLKPKAMLLVGSFVTDYLWTGGGINNPKTKKEALGISTYATYLPDYAKASKFDYQNHVKTCFRAYSQAIGVQSENGCTKVTLIQNSSEIEALFIANKGKICSWDFETNGIEHKAYGTTLFATGLALSFEEGVSYFVPLQGYGCDRDFILEVCSLLLKYVVSNSQAVMVGHNLKYDLHVLSHYLGEQVQVNATYHDTMYLDFLLYDAQKHGLKDIVEREFPKMAGYEDAVNTYKWDNVPLEILSEYAGIDADMTRRILLMYLERLDKDQLLVNAYNNLIMPAAITTFYMERTGLVIDVPYMQSAIADVTLLIKDCEKRIFALPRLQKFISVQTSLAAKKQIIELQDKYNERREKGQKEGALDTKYLQQIEDLRTGVVTNYKGFSVKSTKDVADFLYSPEGLKLSCAGGKGTGEDVVKHLGDKSGFVDLLLEHRSLCKTLSTYLEGFDKHLDPKGRVHTSFKITGTSTGRWSSSDPNVQNLTNEFKQKYVTTKKAASYVKGMFTPPKGYKIVQIDYSQAELRLIAYYAQCRYMLDAYNKGIDQHALTAADVMGITLEEFYKLDKDTQKLKRFQAKAVNFGLIYGMSAFGFMNYALNDYGLTFTIEEATAIRNVFFAKRPELLVYHETYKAKARKFGYVRTLLGTKRHLPDIKSEVEWKRAEAERQAINTPIQGTCGQLTSLAVCELAKVLDSSTQLVNSVHDSIIFYVKATLTDSEIEKAVAVCENLPLEKYFGRGLSEEGRLPITMKVDVEVSDTRWSEMATYAA